MPDNAVGAGPLAVLSRFRVDFHACLSLAPEHRRGHGALYDAVSCGRVDIGRLRRSLAGPSEEVVLIPAINGRPVISRADMAARGVLRTTVNSWYRHRARTRHPEKAGRIGRTDYWYEDEWTTRHEGHLRGKVESLTQVDRRGDPDDLVDASEAARMLRYASGDVIHANRRLGYFPEPGGSSGSSRRHAHPQAARSISADKTPRLNPGCASTAERSPGGRVRRLA